MTTETTKQNLYELAYFISPQVKDDEVASYLGKLRELITGNKGEISKEEIPHRRRLAYPIKHHKDGYFGYFHFTAPAKSTKEMDSALILDSSILRHLIVAVDKKQITQMQKSAQSVSTQEKVKKMIKKSKAEESIFKKEDAVSHIEEHKVELEELDKKLEEILNK